ncbi:MAG: hypothetical protein HY976_03690 [Candidatus Kerfeldbacteria bacterium]|nr:hypothetical protein [Candidatus Kerfeldbacteria bacterium]
MTKHLQTIFGWYGALALITGYILISLDRIEARSLPYQLLVLTGCTGIVIEALHKKDMPPVILNIVSIGVAIITIVTLLR